MKSIKSSVLLASLLMTIIPSLSLGNYACVSDTETIKSFFQNCSSHEQCIPDVGMWGPGQIETESHPGLNGSPAILIKCKSVNCVPGDNDERYWDSLLVHSCEDQVIYVTNISGGGGGAGAGGAGGGSGDGPKLKCGSILDIDNQNLREKIPIVGTSFELYYSSDRVFDRVKNRTIKIPLSGATVNSSVASIQVQIFNEVNFLLSSATYSTIMPNQFHTYVGTGLTSSAVPSISSLKYKVNIKEVNSGYTLDFDHYYNVGNFMAVNIGLGGWTPSVWHFYDHSSSVLNRGDGSVHSVKALSLPGSEFRVAEKDGSLVHEFDAVGKILRTRTGITGQIIRTFAYSGNKLISITEQPGARVTQFVYNSSGKLQAIVSPKLQSTLVSTDSNGYLDEVISPSLEKYELSYTSGGLLLSFKKPNGAISSFTYDSDGNLTLDSHSGGYFSSLARITEGIYSYTNQYKTKMGRELSIVEEGYRRKTIHADGVESISQVDLANKSIIENHRSVDTSIYWQNDFRFGDMVRSIVSSSYSNGSFYRYNLYTETGTLSNPLDPFSISSWSIIQDDGVSILSSVYSPSNKEWNTSSKLGKTIRKRMDNYERPLEYQRGNLATISYSYVDDKLVQVSQGARTTSFGYDSLTGNLNQVTNALSQSTGFVYNSANRLSAVVYPDLRVLNFGYDLIGNVTSVVPPSKPMHAFSFNSSELLNSYSPPLLSGITNVSTNYIYNDDKQLIEIQRPDSQIIEFVYNAVTGDLSSMITPSGAYTYVMNPSGRFFGTIESPDDYMLAQYASGDHIFSLNVTRPLLGTLLYEYSNSLGSPNGKMISDSLVVGASTSNISYVYNDDGDLTKVGNLNLTYNFPNGLLTGTSQGSATDSYTYNSFGEIDGYISKYGSTTLYSVSYLRDLLGRIEEKTEFHNGVSNVFSYQYDSSGRLSQVSKNSVIVATYGYDSNGNRNSGTVYGVATSASYDDQDRLNSYNIFDYSYNQNGDLISKVNTLTSELTTYNYDVLGNIKAVDLPGINIVTYEVDPLNRRVARKLNGTVTRRYAYDSDNKLIAEINANGTLYRRYVYGSKRYVPDYFVQGSTRYRIYSDHLGSPRVVVNVSNGSVMHRMDHDEFGRVTLDTNPGYLPFGFAGGLYDHQTGLVRFGARDYDPEVGRWTSKDSILFKGGDTNLMGYVANDPVNKIDPTGLYEVCTRPLSGLDDQYGPVYHQFLCANGVCGGQGPSGSSWGSPGSNTSDSSSGGGVTCKEGPKDNKQCMDKCISDAIGGSRPYYRWHGVGGTNCQQWADNAVSSCAAKCGGK